MRFAASFIITVCMLGSVALCRMLLTQDVRFDLVRDEEKPSVSVETGISEHLFCLVLTPAFDAARDPFALILDTGTETSRIRVTHQEKMVIDWQEDVRNGVPIRQTDIPFTGDTVELFIEASPSGNGATFPCALRIQIVNDNGTLCDEQTLWSEGGGAKISGKIRLRLTPQPAGLDRGLSGNAS